MHDAIELLDLHKGNRLGHGTAMGIDPELWMSRMPPKVIISRGDWFLSLLTVWKLQKYAASVFGSHLKFKSVEDELKRLTIEIFNKYIDPIQCVAAMDFRKVNPALAHEYDTWEEKFKGTLFFDDFLNSEQTILISNIEQNPEAYKFYIAWQFDKDLWKRSEELISIETRFLPADQCVLLQQALMQMVKERGIVIETLPSSNVRIAPYHSFAEHHALRWMRVTGAVKDGDPEIGVSLGSDDPGIFSTDLEIEFYHLFYALKQSGLSEDEALARVSRVNDRGRTYRFHPPHEDLR